jgi:hypothetical protein
MSTAELLTVIFGLLLGYGIISRWLGRRHVNGEGATGSDDPHREWVRGHCHEILGVSPDAPFEAIYSAYRSKVSNTIRTGQRGWGPSSGHWRHGRSKT